MKTNQWFWNRFAFLYDAFIKRDRAAYETMYALISHALTKDMVVLEIATGTGLVALQMADHVKEIIATDFSPQMIAVAQGKAHPSNLRFEVADAIDLPFEAEAFHAIIIANALHIMPEPAKVLSEIMRVLRPGGILFAPTFTHAQNTWLGKFRSALMKAAGFKVFHEWTDEEYKLFLEENHFTITKSVILPASFPLTYVETVRKT